VERAIQTGARNQYGCGSFLMVRVLPLSSRSFHMSIKGHIKEAVGFAKEEANEYGKSAASKAKAQEGRKLRNEGRIEDGKPPKTTKPGTGR
jgi:hypothetical protein